MKFRPHAIALAVLASLAGPACADDAPTQTTITIYAAGRPVAGLMMPIGAKGNLSANANHIDDGDTGARFTGNVQAQLALPAGQPLVIYGEEIALKTEKLSPERVKAVRDLEAMAVTDQLYRGKSVTGDLSADEWKRQTEIDARNMKRLAEIIDAFGWPGLRFAGAASETAFLVLSMPTTPASASTCRCCARPSSATMPSEATWPCWRTASASPTASHSCTAPSWRTTRCASSRSKTKPMSTRAAAASACRRWRSTPGCSG